MPCPTAVFLLILYVLITGGSSPSEPVAEMRPFTVESPNGDRIDEYYWMRDRNDPAVLACLEAENAYADSLLAPLEPLVDSLMSEMASRIALSDSSVPYPYGGFLYWSRFDEGSEYPVYLRRPEAGGPAAVVLDVTALAEGRDYMDAWPRVSPDGAIAGIVFDTTGSLDYTLVFSEMESGRLLNDTIRTTDGSLVWANDSRTVFYGALDSTWRTCRIMRHTLGTPEEDDETVFEENDPMFWPYVYKSSDDGYVLIQTSSTESCETWILDADDPQGAFSVVEPRAPGHEYSVEALGDTLYILTNLGAKNFRVMSAPVVEPSGQHWTEVVPARDDVLIESIEAFPGFVAMLVKSGGFSELRTVNLASGSESVAAGGDEPSSIWFESNRRPSDRLVRYGYCSFTTPVQTRSLDLSTGISSVLKQDSVGGGFDGSRYSSTVMYAPSHDGVEVPISMVWRSDMGDPVDRPLLLEGYGAYGYSSDPWFSSSMLSLLDRGFVFAIAHVRGGSEMGREWYEDGRLMNKRNTFLDFIACAEYLVNTGVTSRDRMFARGGSAGGLLVGAVTNMSPGLFRGVIANVPFVDVVTTMLDPGIPLTTNEYEEWGDPSVPAFYEYMLSYSPYDNVAAADYPAMFVTAGWNDSQVCYWEPSKWVARIRRLRTDDDPVVFRIDMGAGHAGESGRFGWLKNAATEQAFLIGLLRSEAALRYSIP